MTRLMDPIAVAASRATRLRQALLVSLSFPSAVVYLWSGLGDLVWDGKTFMGMGALLSVSSIGETAEVRAEGVSIALSGMTQEIVAVAQTEEGIRGRPALIWMAFFEDDGTFLGEPTLLVRARMDQFSWKEGSDYVLQMTLENNLLDLERPRITRYTNEDQQNRHPGDLFFDKMTSIAAGKTVSWGRATPT